MSRSVIIGHDSIRLFYDTAMDLIKNDKASVNFVDIRLELIEWLRKENNKNGKPTFGKTYTINANRAIREIIILMNKAIVHRIVNEQEIFVLPNNDGFMAVCQPKISGKKYRYDYANSMAMPIPYLFLKPMLVRKYGNAFISFPGGSEQMIKDNISRGIRYPTYNETLEKIRGYVNK